MSTPTNRPYYIVCRPEAINGRMAAHGGKLLLNLPNYVELLTSLPQIADESLQVFEVEVPSDLVRVQQEGNREVHLLWSGEKHARSRTGELVTVAVRSLVGFESDEQKGDPVQVAGALFAAYPPAVQLAAVVANLDDATLAAAGIDPVKGREWATKTLAHAEAVAASHA